MADLFEDKAAGWDERPIPMRISEGVSAAIQARVSLTEDMQVLDFGAGTGLVCSQIAPKVGYVYAVDISASMLQKLEEKTELLGKVETVCQDILKKPLNKPVDLIMSAMAMHHVEDTDRLLSTFYAHLGPGGQIALADLDAEDGTFHPPAIKGVFHHGFDRLEFTKKLTAAGFSDIEFTTAVDLQKQDQHYPVFLVTGRRAS